MVFTVEIASKMVDVYLIRFFFADFNECEAGVSGCQHKCKNSVGRFSCECFFGYILKEDRKTCEKGEPIICQVYRKRVYYL